MQQQRPKTHSVTAIGWRAATLLALAVFTLGLKAMPYRVVSKLMPRAGTRPAAAWRKRQLQSNMAWSARWIPGATCLPQAMAGYLLFAIMGFEARIRIAVERSASGGLSAHATLMSGDHVIVGDSPQYRSFSPMTELKPGQ